MENAVAESRDSFTYPAPGSEDEKSAHHANIRHMSPGLFRAKLLRRHFH
jgi:hypothetical protein